MGGSSGYGRYTSIGDVSRLEGIARKELKKPPPEPRRRVFLSFRGEDIDLVNLFRGQAKNEYSDLDFIDYSLRVPFDSENAEYIRRGIRERIRQSSVCVVLIGESTYKSRWVDCEIRESMRLGKGVVAMKLRDDPSIKLPNALTEHGIKPVPWDHKIMKDAINKASEDR